MRSLPAIYMSKMQIGVCGLKVQIHLRFLLSDHKECKCPFEAEELSVLEIKDAKFGQTGSCLLAGK